MIRRFAVLVTRAVVWFGRLLDTDLGALIWPRCPLCKGRIARGQFTVLAMGRRIHWACGVRRTERRAPEYHNHVDIGMSALAGRSND
jgi:hypothetical protein